ncbi:MAG: formylglycine-generating enzyme family protein [Candidatus Delongbacteria bacterium]|nr:formylglycine-generating enzyme family protein [Candidatus Delongbacteria bacterium]
MVKKGELKDYPGEKIGAALENYMGPCIWEYSRNEEGSDFVKVKGKIPYNGSEVSAMIIYQVITSKDFIPVSIILEGEEYNTQEHFRGFHKFAFTSVSSDQDNLSKIDYIEIVKKGELKDYPGKKIGATLENYMGPCTWEYTRDEEGNDFVKVNGKLTIEGNVCNVATIYQIITLENIKLVAISADEQNIEEEYILNEFLEEVFGNAYSDKSNLSDNKKEEITDLVGSMVLVEGGTFKMGSNVGSIVEKPIHNVTVSDFFICKTEITQAQFKAIMGNNPSSFKGDNNPVETVSWNDAVEFCKKLSKKEGVTYRLPTEAEWEYAARGGNRSRGYKYSGSDNIGIVAEYNGNNNKSTNPVGGKQPNELGIYDMTGNVWEWCSDRYADNYYNNCPSNNPKGPNSGSYRVLRGGSWSDFAGNCHVTFRHYYFPDIENYSLPGYMNDTFGFRIVRSK